MIVGFLSTTATTITTTEYSGVVIDGVGSSHCSSRYSMGLSRVVALLLELVLSSPDVIGIGRRGCTVCVGETGLCEVSN